MIRKQWALDKLREIDRHFGTPDDVHIVLTLLPQPFTIDGRICQGWCRPKGVIDGMRTYHIGIVHTLDTDEAVLVLVHEWRHVDQYVKGWLEDVPIYPDGTQRQAWSTTWKGQPGSHLPYWSQPWEVDAREFEQHAWRFFDE